MAPFFCGINIDWNYPAGTIDLNMPNYIPKAHLKFQHSAPTCHNINRTNMLPSNLVPEFSG